MPSSLALLLTTIFVVLLFRWDRRQAPPVTLALWIPLAWLLITASRPVSVWLGWGGAFNTLGAIEEGSPLDRAVYIALQVTALVVLLKRRVDWPAVVSQNMAITLFVIYCGLAVLWSDFAFVALKRWVKFVGLPMMILIIATEPYPREALVRLFKRAAYILVPFSILLIKYYPHLGRGFDNWTGAPMNLGVTTNKNELGYVCLMLGFVFIWHLTATLRLPKTPERRSELVLCAAFLGMIGWLMSMADSATSLMCLAIGSAIVLFLGLRKIDLRLAPAYLIGGVLLLFGIEAMFGVSDVLFAALGRDSTLTGRTGLWARLMLFDINPLIGVGYESFWLGPRSAILAMEYWWIPNQAHNGYVETYLNLGWIGLILLVGVLASLFLKAREALLTDLPWGQFQLGALGILMAYNYTEAAFKHIHPLAFLLYAAALTYRPTPHPVTGDTHDRGPERAAAGARGNTIRRNAHGTP
jgi:exopolysaccharide production protein ExoQ